MNIRTPTDLGALVRERRREQDVDQRALAARVGVSREWIIRLEAGKPGVSLGLVLRTLDALGIQLVVPPPANSKSRPVRKATLPDIDAVVRKARGTATRRRR